MTTVALDTSVAIPLLVRGHPAHRAVIRWAGDHDLVLAGHAQVETFSVLTRLPDALRLDASAALRAIRAGFGAPVHPRHPDAALQRIADADITGGAVYDAMVAIAAEDAGVPLATSDARAVPTYARIGVRVVIVR